MSSTTAQSVASKKDAGAYPPFFRKLLERRNLTAPEEIERFLHPDYDRDTHDPLLLTDIEKAAGRIWRAVDRGEKVLIYADYDADGIAAASILSDFFRAAAYRHGVYMPDRQEEGHGLNMKAVGGFIKDGVGLIVTLDCGVGDHKEIERLQAAGIDVIVVDHHQVIGGLPPACAVVDPHREGDRYPFKGLCGASLAFKLLQVLVSDGRMEGRWGAGQEKWRLDLVALATVADMMPMLGENRALVRCGLFVLARTRRAGLKELFRVSGVEPMFNDNDMSTNINEITVGFTLGPRINAASRMAHAGAAYDLLMSETPRAARSLALELEENNSLRKKEIGRVEREVRALLKKKGETPPFVFEGSERWPITLLGLVASRVAEVQGVPAGLVDLSGKVAKASFRAPDGFDLIASLGSVSKHLVQYGGHTRAAGATFEKDKFEDVSRALEEYAERNPPAQAAEKAEETELSLEEITLSNASLVQTLAPFGEGNPVPLFLVRGAVLARVELMGKDGSHAKMFFTDGKREVPAMLFFHNGGVGKLKEGERHDIIGELSVNEWKGRRSAQFKVVDIRPHRNRES